MILPKQEVSIQPKHRKGYRPVEGVNWPREGSPVLSETTLTQTGNDPP